MKAGKRAESTQKVAKTELNQNKKNLVLVVIIIITVLLIAWIINMSKRADRTVSVAMYTQDIGKNTPMTEDMFCKYEMNQAEFDKYATEDENGTMKRRIVLWEEVPDALGTFAAYPLHKNTVCMYKDLIFERIDNSDSVMYNFPGKTIVALNIDTSDLDSYKTFIEPGDKINITCISTKTTDVESADGSTSSTVETTVAEPLFNDITVADLINNDGDSILDIYEEYKNKTTYEQAQLDADETFKESVQPASLLVALTPEELDAYYIKLAGDYEFKMSLPQRNK